MARLEQLQAFVASVDQGSFSAAARHLGKAQSAVSHLIATLEIDTQLTLFDRSTRRPSLTSEGQQLLNHARSILQSLHDFDAKAVSLGDQTQSRLCLAIEQNICSQSLMPTLQAFEHTFPLLELELLDPGSHDVPTLITSGRAHLGLMIEQEEYPQDFSFRGIGYSTLIPVAHPEHPLHRYQSVQHHHLRQYRQLIPSSLHQQDTALEKRQISAQVWRCESPFVCLDLLHNRIGWAFIHHAVVEKALAGGTLKALNLGYAQAGILLGIDLVWTRETPLGQAGQWLLEALQTVSWHPSPRQTAF